MQLFSQRIGKKPLKNVIQSESIDSDLKNALWNGLTIYYWIGLVKHSWIEENKPEVKLFLKRIWTIFFKNRLDEIPSEFFQLNAYIKQFYFQAEWFEIYDFIEFVPLNYKSDPYDPTNSRFIEYCNKVLERELSAFRFINGILTKISTKEEIDAIEEALNISDRFKPVKTHLQRALELFSDRKTPDYRNSIKESISAVEAYCSILTIDSNATLGQALKVIEKNNIIHPALRNSFSSLYGYSSNADGIRHALLDDDNLRQEDAKFMLVACSAFVSYLIQKEAKTKQ
jgi:hypothetical protein